MNFKADVIPLPEKVRRQVMQRFLDATGGRAPYDRTMRVAHSAAKDPLQQEDPEAVLPGAFVRAGKTEQGPEHGEDPAYNPETYPARLHFL